MKYWMQPANPKIFKITELFQKRDVVDWRQFRNYEIGDIVYLYIARPISQVVFKAEVIGIGIIFAIAMLAVFLHATKKAAQKA